jgi:hypothetical protein
LKRIGEPRFPEQTEGPLGRLAGNGGDEDEDEDEDEEGEE